MSENENDNSYSTNTAPENPVPVEPAKESPAIAEGTQGLEQNQQQKSQDNSQQGGSDPGEPGKNNTGSTGSGSDDSGSGADEDKNSSNDKRPETPKDFTNSKYPPDDWKTDTTTIKLTERLTISSVRILNIKVENSKPFSGWFLWNNMEKMASYSDFNGFDFLQTIDEREKVNNIIKRLYPDTKEDLDALLLMAAKKLSQVYSWITIEHKREEDIEVSHNDEIPPMDFSGLPEYNYIRQLIEFIAKYTNTYKEYTWHHGLDSLSLAVMRKLRFPLNGKWYYTNLKLKVLGDSGDGKTPTFEISQDILKEALGNAFLSHPISVQALRDEIATEIFQLKTDEASGEEVKHIIKKESTDGIPKRLCHLWMDEANKFLSMLSATYSVGQSNFINTLFGCPNSLTDEDKAGNVVVRCDKPIYYGENLSTTEEEFNDHITAADIKSGSYARDLIIVPEYKIPFRKNTRDAPGKENGTDFFVNQLRFLNSIMPDEPVEVKFTQEAQDLFDEWNKERVEYFEKENNKIMKAFIKKFLVNVHKVAILIELGNIPYMFSQWVEQQGNVEQLNNVINIHYIEILRKNDPLYANKNMTFNLSCESDRLIYNNKYTIEDYKIKALTVSTNSFKYALKIFDEIYLRHHTRLFESVREDKLSKYLPIVYKNIRNKKKVKKSALRVSIGGSEKEFEDAIHTLKELGLVSEYWVKGTTRPMTIYAYTAPSSKNYPFKVKIEMDDKPNDAVVVLEKQLPKFVEAPRKDENAKVSNIQKINVATLPKIVAAYNKFVFETLKLNKQPTKDYVVIIDDSVAKILDRDKIRYTSETFFAAKSVFYAEHGWNENPES